jgi:N-ATPase, AtpR subunit
MSHETLLWMPALALTMAVGGFVFGLVYFAALRRTATSFTAGRRLVALALTLGRIGAAVLFLGLAAKLGAASLLAAFLGFLLARMVALRAARSAG